MARKKIFKLDVEKARQALSDRGKHCNRDQFSKRYGMTTTTYFNYRMGRVPNSILALWRIQKDTGLTLKDLIYQDYEEVTDTNNGSEPDNGRNTADK